MQSVSSIRLIDAAATHALGATLGQVILAGTVLLLDGDLGSGKTTFVQGLGAALGVRDAIVSPTFTLINEYPEARIPLYHFDLYRLQPDETADLNLEGYWNGDYPVGLVAIEWAERLKYLPPEYLRLQLSMLDLQDESRAAAGRLAQFAAVGRLPQQVLQVLLVQLGQTAG